MRPQELRERRERRERILAWCTRETGAGRLLPALELVMRAAAKRCSWGGSSAQHCPGLSVSGIVRRGRFPLH